MEWLQNITLPQSLEHIKLLQFMLVISLFIFISFASVIFWGTGLSVYFKSNEKKHLDDKYGKIAKDIIKLVTINKSIGIILGVVPLITLILIFAQLFQSAEVTNLNDLTASLILLSIAMVFIYIYKNSLADLKKPRLIFGITGFIIMFFALWLFLAGMTVAVFHGHWQPEGTISDLFSSLVIIRFLYFVVASLAVTGGAVFFGLFFPISSKIKTDEEYAQFVKSKMLIVTFVATILLPLIMLANLIIVPETSLSGAIFAYIIIGLFLLFLAYHFLYMIFVKFSSKFTALLFFTLLLMLLTVIINDKIIITNSTKVQSAVLAVEYDELLAELKGEDVAVELNGEEIYKVRCASCHKFDIKLVGPPHNEVVPKYFGKEELLLAFIKNPGRIDETYPPMPNPGLKSDEAKAVADYVLEQVKKNVAK
jgi:cytochrome c